jgi:hypothetical protein
MPEQEIMNHKFLNNVSEHEIFSFINLVRVAPMHCMNTIFESVRNRYNYKNRKYENIINLNRGNDTGPSYE